MSREKSVTSRVNYVEIPNTFIFSSCVLTTLLKYVVRRKYSYWQNVHATQHTYIHND